MEPDRWTRGPLARFACFALLTALLFPGCATARAPHAELEQIAAALDLRSGMHVADIGAGDGEWTEALAARVGEDGQVLATEVDEEDVEDLRTRMEDAELNNVTVSLGNELDLGLPDDCCDGILLRLVYHHFTEPEPMQQNLRAVLRPGGRLVVVEITPQADWSVLEGVPDRDGHGILPEDLIEEMTSGGWVVVERHDDWGSEQDHYCVVFR